MRRACGPVKRSGRPHQRINLYERHALGWRYERGDHGHLANISVRPRDGPPRHGAGRWMAFRRRMIEVQLVYSSARRLVTAMLLVPMSLGVLLLACAVATGRVGYVTTNGVSMNPVYYQGDLVVVARADSYKIGQIVAYRLPAKHLVVLHRIIGGDASGYIVKGDNNQSTDPTRPAGDQLIGRAVLHIAHGGIWFDRVTSPTALGILAFLLLAGGGGAVQTRRRRRRGTM